MKIRTCFVSNSSSSSFIVKFPKRPESKAELEKLLDFDSAYANWRDYYETRYTKDEILESIWNELCRIIEERDKIMAADIKDFSSWEFEEFLESLGITFADLIEKPLVYYLRGDNYTFQFVFSDECGDFWSAMEHIVGHHIFGKYLVSWESRH